MAPVVFISQRQTLWRVQVALNRRNARKGMGPMGLRYVLVRGNNPLSIRRPGRPNCRQAGEILVGVRESKLRLRWKGETLNFDIRCDALRCSGPHARYTDRANEFITLSERSG
jgi:hypothetical protein